jgi:hypothetical protein
MAEKKDVDAWADALLDQHRTAPRRNRDRDAGGSVEDLPAGMRMMIRLGEGEPDPEQIERLLRRSERLATLQKIDAVITVVSLVLLCAGAYVLFSQF